MLVTELRKNINALNIFSERFRTTDLLIEIYLSLQYFENIRQLSTLFY